MSTSLLYEMAQMMRDPVEEVGSCGRRCCVEVDGQDGAAETRLLDLDDSITPETDPCQVYTCTVGE